jgi:hypothetical protein
MCRLRKCAKVIREEVIIFFGPLRFILIDCISKGYG